MVENRIHHTFWCINPNSGDTGGLVGNDWSTWDEEKYGLLKPALWQTKDGKFIGLDHKIPLGSNGISLGEYYGTPQVSDPPATPTPTKPINSPTPEVSPTPAFIYGDINDDGKINSSDLTALRRIIVKSPPENANMDAADVNADGKVNSTDYSILKRYLLRSITELPYN
ncbi:endoglucanase [Acetivibrio straminisolvens JCM 21531]|uniref:Endoglucanase n=2 Tax=Acetivibrio straminisolvens TaxID=253314 RepID=W4V6A2_9FIRM|nr:endoglucanase [Acetivibrio straminisolvens JCM 21531]